MRILHFIALLASQSIAISHRSSIASASAVDDRCSKDQPCTPSEDDSLYCDFSIGPTTGGYCAPCLGRQTSFCSSDEEDLSDTGSEDCHKKCSYKACDGSCDEGYFCSLYNYDEGPCVRCETLVVHPRDCQIFNEWQEEGINACEETCPPKSCTKRRHCLSNDAAVKYFCNFDETDGDGEEEPAGTCDICAGLASVDECSGRGASELAVQECIQVCEDVIPVPCGSNTDCKEDFFCNEDSAVCQTCPTSQTFYEWHVNICFNSTEMDLNSDASQQNCATACHTECNDETEGAISIEGLENNGTIGKDDNIPMQGAPYAQVSGPLVDCQFGAPGECPSDAPENFICLVSRGKFKFSDKVINCEESGAIGTILYNNAEDGSIVEGGVGDAPVEIPITAISLHKGLHLVEHGLGLNATVMTKKLDDDCETGCSDDIPCPDSWYCDYSKIDHGYCQECGADDKSDDEQRVECFLSGLQLEGAQECASTCDKTLTSPSCKICGKGISGDSLGSAGEGDAKCNFCPGGMKKSNYDREIPFIGNNATCFKLNQFFLNYPISEEDPNCQLALNFNYICECEDSGYAGANSDAKKAALVWAPRASAILSFFSSSAIIFDVAKNKNIREKVYGQLMLIMSIFDLMGSAAYALTTLPIPTEYYIKGSQGNGATQGFFIQMGTTAAFVNVSLAVYYFCIIKLGWSDGKIMRIRKWLFACPITVGLAFAFAGIPFYGMLFLWCNNSAAWWPDIPVAFAIIVTTCTMVSTCWHVYKTEKASQQYTRSNSLSTSSLVFWQSLWYLLSFYLTWPPYLALQYLWAAGSYNVSYSFVIIATTLVPLQGFWNCVVFFRLRAKKNVNQMASRVSSNISRVKSRFSVASFAPHGSMGPAAPPGEGSAVTPKEPHVNEYGQQRSSSVGHDPNMNGLSKSSKESEGSFEDFVRFACDGKAGNDPNMNGLSKSSKESEGSFEDFVRFAFDGEAKERTPVQFAASETL